MIRAVLKILARVKLARPDLIGQVGVGHVASLTVIDDCITNEHLFAAHTHLKEPGHAVDDHKDEDGQDEHPGLEIVALAKEGSTDRNEPGIEEGKSFVISLSTTLDTCLAAAAADFAHLSAVNATVIQPEPDKKIWVRGMKKGMA